jgi:hypothetical protein
MGEIRPPLSVKLFIGMLSADPSVFDACAKILHTEYGPLDLTSGRIPWEKTDYYQDELGTGICRQFLFFERLMDPAKLPSIKIFTNDLEKRFARGAEQDLRRRINLDPGYVTEAKVVLATTKDFAHRVYIGEGIYAEVTLRYLAKQHSFTPHEFTYPDFGTQAYLALFNKARANLREAMHRCE